MSARTRCGYLVLNAMALALVAGCGGKGKESSGEFVDATEALAVAQDLAGRYAHYDVVAYESTTMKTLIVSYGFTDLTEVDGKLIAQESFCHAEHRSDQPISTSLSDAATQAIKPKSIAVEITREDGRYKLWRAETPTGIGIHLEDPANEPLPKDPKDPRIADDDKDGHPGITVKIKVSDSLMGELYIARREIFAYGVVEQDDGALIGTVSDHSEQLVIGASDDIFLMSTEWTQHPDFEKSPIILKPVDGVWDCERLMQARDALFPPTPEVDW